MAASTHKPVLIVIAGPNGSGKTTITTKVLHHEWLEGAVYVNPDIVAQERFGDWNSYDAVMKAVDYCASLRENCLNNKESLIFETVMSAPDKIDFIKRAKEAGFFIRLFYVSTIHPAINASRIAKRVMKGGHDVPIKKVISRYYKSLLNCRIAAAYADRTYVYDNSQEDKEATLLYRMTEGKLMKQYVADLPEWAKEIL